MQDLWNSSQWLVTPKAYWTIQYEYQRSGFDMQYRFYWKVWLGSSSNYYYDGLKLKLFINGIPYEITVKPYQTGVTGWSYDGTTEWITLYNTTSGTVPFYAQLYDTTASVTKVTSSIYYLNVSPTGATITSAPDFNDEEVPTIQYSNPHGNNVTSLKACISLNGQYADVAYRDLEPSKTSYRFILSPSEKKALRKATTGNSREVTFFLVTKIGDAEFVNAVTSKYSIVNGNPTFTSDQISYADTSEWKNVTENPLHIVQNQSNLAVTFTSATANKEATIIKYDITVNDVTDMAEHSGQAEYTIDYGKINSSKNFDISVTATDSRGNSTTATKTVEVLAWTEPTFTVKLERLNNYEDETYLTVDAKYSSVNGKNNIGISYWLKESGGEYGAEVAINNRAKQTLQCDKNKAYVFKVQVRDLFDEVTYEYPLPKGKFPLFIDTQKNAIGINEFPAANEALRVSGGIANFLDGIAVNGNAVDYPIEQGIDYRGWEYCKYKSGKAECKKIYTITNAAITKAWGYVFETEWGHEAPFPTDLFIDTPILNMFVQSATDGILGLETMGETTKDVTCLFYPLRATPLTVSSIAISLTATGRWKN